MNSSSNDIFLVDDEVTLTYGDLFGFTTALAEKLDDSEKPVLIPGFRHPLIVSAVAACSLLGKPAIIFGDHNKQHATGLADKTSFYLTIDSLPTEFSVNCDSSQTIVLDPLSGKKDQTIRRFEEVDSRHLVTLFTSGTTGEARPVHISRQQMLTAANNAANNFKPDTGEQWVLCLPLFHMGGLSIIYRSLIYGSAIHLLRDFDSETFTRKIKHHHEIRYASMVPTQLHRVLKENPPENHFLKAILIGGGPISADLLNRARANHLPAIGSYGMTETCGQVAAQPVNNPEQTPVSSAGKLFDNHEIQIRDESNGKILPENSSGLIYLKGNQLPDIDLNPHLIDKFDEDGWFATGDFGYVDEQDNIYIEARREDLIITGGENVVPQKVEEVLLSIPALDDVAITGIPDEEWGQKIVAVYTGEKPADEQLQHEVRAKLPRFALPGAWIKVEAVPRNRLGKIERHKVREIVMKRS